MFGRRLSQWPKSVLISLTLTLLAFAMSYYESLPLGAERREFPVSAKPPGEAFIAEFRLNRSIRYLVHFEFKKGAASDVIERWVEGDRPREFESLELNWKLFENGALLREERTQTQGTFQNRRTVWRSTLINSTRKRMRLIELNSRHRSRWTGRFLSIPRSL